MREGTRCGRSLPTCVYMRGLSRSLKGNPESIVRCKSITEWPRRTHRSITGATSWRGRSSVMEPLRPRRVLRVRDGGGAVCHVRCAAMVRSARMIFTTLVLEEDPPGVNHLRGQLGGSASGLAAGLPMQVTMDLTKRLMELATPIEASESFLCTICLNGKTEEDAQVAWVQLACGHPLHRSCYRQLIHHNLFRCRCPLCRFDFLQLLLQET